MSLFTDASLVMIPSGVKDGKLYSIKPDDGVGDFTFTRGSNLAATRVDENGLIEKGRENLFLNSDAPVTQSITISNGTVYTLSFKGTGSIVAIGGGSFILNGTGATDLVQQYFVSSSTTITLTLSGTITEPQLELGLVATDYIETGATTEQAGILENLPRLDYTDSSCPSLLLEPTRSNLFLQSEYFDGIEWSTTRCDIDSNLLTSPEGLINASKMTSTDVNESYVEELITTTLTKTTFSFFAKKGDIDYVHGMFWDGVANGCRQWFNVNTGVTGGTTTFGSGYSVDSSSIQDFGNGWYRCIMTVNSSAGSNRCRLNISSADTVITSPVSSYGYFYGAQVEEGSYPTSYIPTYGTSVTRSGDVCKDAGDATTFNDAEGVLFLDLESFTDTNSGTLFITINNNGTSSIVGIRYLVDGTLQFVNTPLGTANIAYSAYQDLTSRTKLAFKYGVSSGDYSVYINGVKKTILGTFVASTLTGLSDLDIFYPNGTQNFYGRINKVIVFPTALTDSELAALTTI